MYVSKGRSKTQFGYASFRKAIPFGRVSSTLNPV
jgi:hypothetical protein